MLPNLINEIREIDVLDDFHVVALTPGFPGAKSFHIKNIIDWVPCNFTENMSTAKLYEIDLVIPIFITLNLSSNPKSIENFEYMID